MTTKQIQHLLSYLGYDTGGVDGVLGPKTKAAVYDFQAAYKDLEADGLPGRMTQAALQKAVGSGWVRPQQVSNMDIQDKPSTGSFWDGIRHFERAEFACKCGQYCDGFPAEPEERLIQLAERVREHFGKPMTVTSGVRCPRHNANVGGVANSRHLSGKAVDFVVSGIPASIVLPYVQSLSGVHYTYAINNSAVHMDVD